MNNYKHQYDFFGLTNFVSSNDYFNNLDPEDKIYGNKKHFIEQCFGQGTQKKLFSLIKTTNNIDYYNCATNVLFEKYGIEI